MLCFYASGTLDSVYGMLSNWENILNEVRVTAPSFKSIQFKEVKNGADLLADEQMLRRAKCLWALQYNRSDADDLLLRTIFEAEVQWHSNAPFQGFAKELTVAALLLAKRPPSDVLQLMWSAKSANFDTWCGFDSRLLGCGGVESAISEARELGDESLLNHLTDEDQPLFSDDEVAEYLEDMDAWIPTSPTDEVPATWFRRAQMLDEKNVAKEVLDDWCASSSPPEDSYLQQALASIGFFAEAVDTQQRILAKADSARTELHLLKLAELERLAGFYDGSFANLKNVWNLIKSSRNGNTYYRKVVEEGFTLSVVTEGAFASEVFEFAEKIDRSCYGRRTSKFKINKKPEREWLPLNVLKEAVEAASKLGNTSAEMAYKRRAETKRHRINQATGEI